MKKSIMRMLRYRGKMRRGTKVLIVISAVIIFVAVIIFSSGRIETIVKTPPFAGKIEPESDIVAIAQGELGNDYKKYCDWWGYPDRQEWCAVFVCWCADQAGYTEDVDYIKTMGVNEDTGNPRDTGSGAGCHARFHNKDERYKTRESGYIPKSGDFIYFDWEMDNEKEGNLVMDHIAIVESVAFGRVYTIEGNSQIGENTPDLVRKKNYDILDERIKGYSDMSGITVTADISESK